MASVTAAKSSERNSCASSECSVSGAPRRKKISSSRRGTRVAAWRSGRAMMETVLV